MKHKYILKLFIQFLKEEGIYTYYVNALKEDRTHYRKYSIGAYNCENPVNFIVKCIKNNTLHRLINYAFSWTTYNNVDWCQYTKKWEKKLCEKKIIKNPW